MDRWGSVCALFNLRICASEPSSRCGARYHGCGARGGDGRGGRKAELRTACSHGGGRVGGHSRTCRHIHSNSQQFAGVRGGGPEVECGGFDGNGEADSVHGEAGNPAPGTAIGFPPRPIAQVLVCVDDAEFHDVDFLAAPAVASKQRGRRRSRAVRPGLRRRAFDAASNVACEPRPVRPANEMPGAHKNGN